MDSNLILHIEALIFISRDSISESEIKDTLNHAFETKVPIKDITDAIEQLQQKYQADEYAFELARIGGGYKFITKGAYYDTLASYLKQSTKKRLSTAALETLSLIAYKQPVTKSEIEKIRGVNCDYSIQKLLDKELVEITGRSDGPGRPLIYATSQKFMNYFGIADLHELPKTRDFKIADQEIGEAAPIEESAYIINLSEEEEE
ncbi:MAG: SMC-Scp complex subunit ScpB [Saprospiraceae bacterium]|nr:SMC-Scp complex subunit ScpB [Saprospiraceae bacterium]